MLDAAVVVDVGDGVALLLHKFGEVHRVLGADVVHGVVYLHFLEASLRVCFSGAAVKIGGNHFVFLHAITPFDHYIPTNGGKQAAFMVK